MNLKNNLHQPARLLPACVLSMAGMIGLLAVAEQAVAADAQKADDSEITVVPVRGGIYMLTGPGGNVTVSIGDDGILLVDTMTEAAAPKLLAAIRKLSDKPIRFIINTHLHADHTGGNAAISKAGETVRGGGGNAGVAEDKSATVIAQENVLTAMSTGKPPAPYELWPTDTYIAKSKSLYFNGEPIQIIHMPNAHTNGDSIVFFRRSDVISAGDIYTPTHYAFVDVKNGGTLKGEIDALNDILEMTVPEKIGGGGTLVVPGHGRVGDESDVVEFRDMLTIIRSYVQEMIKEGKSLDQIQKARPTFGYDPLYGSDTGWWTTQQFVEMVYKELRKSK